MKMVSININGIEYNLKGDESEEYLHKVSSYVNSKIKDIMDKNAKLSTSAASVLAALNVADDMFKKEKDCVSLIEEIKEIKSREMKLKENLKTLQQKLQEAKKENDELKNNLKDNIKEINNNETLNNMKEKLVDLEKSIVNYKKENEKLKLENKDMKFEIKSSKYKMINLQQRLIENQMDLVKEKKQNHPLLNVDR